MKLIGAALPGSAGKKSSDWPSRFFRLLLSGCGNLFRGARGGSGRAFVHNCRRHLAFLSFASCKNNSSSWMCEFACSYGQIASSFEASE